MTPPVQRDADVIIAGAGPVGLFLAGLLGAQGVSCLLVERRPDSPPEQSRAIGIMPPTLRLFQAAGLSDAVTAAGCPVPEAVVHDQHGILGRLPFSSLPPPFAYILSLPQCDLMEILQENTARLAPVAFRTGTEVTGLEQDADGVRAELRDGQGRMHTVQAACLAACDGASGRLRSLLQLDAPATAYAPSFLMGDYTDRTAWGAAAHLFFTPGGSVESFPLPQGRRRWVVLADPSVADREAPELRRRIQALTGILLDPGDQQWHSDFTPYYRLNRRYFRGRAMCCGDSAHVMSPIGGQGMNTGLGDAWHLAAVLTQALRGRQPLGPLLEGYERERRRAFRCAARHAACGMWLGTRTGRLPSALRSLVIRQLLFGTALRHRLAPFFAMLTIPGEGAAPPLPFTRERPA